MIGTWKIMISIPKLLAWILTCVFLTSCSSNVSGFSTLGRREIPRPDIYFEASQVEKDNPFSTLVVNGTNAASSTNEVSNSETAGKREQLLGDISSRSVLQMCEFLADQTITTTKLLAQTEGQYSFLWFKDLRLIADYRKTFKPPVNDEKVEIFRCRGYTRTSNLMELETDLVLLLRPDGRLGVRYLPDNATIKFVTG